MIKNIKPKAEKSTVLSLTKMNETLCVDAKNSLWGHFVVNYNMNGLQTIPEFVKTLKPGDKIYVIGESFKPNADICEYEIVAAVKNSGMTARTLNESANSLMAKIQRKMQPQIVK